MHLILSQTVCRGSEHRVSLVMLCTQMRSFHTGAVREDKKPSFTCSSYTSRDSLMRRASLTSGHVSPLMNPHIVLKCTYRFIGDRPPTFAEIAEALKVMDVNINMSEKELKKRYHQLVKKHHPDTGGDEKQMAKIAVAYETLTKLSSREKEQFELQRRSYSPSSGHSTRAGFQSARTGSGAYRRPYEEPGQYDNTNFHRQAEYARAYAQARQGFYTYRNNGPGTTGNSGPNPFSQNPFGATHPFSMGSHFKHFGQMSATSILIRGLLLYLIFSMFAAAAYRSYRDWANDDGWKMAESLSRHEQLAELHRIRQEMKDRMNGVDRAREEAYQRESLGTFAGPFRRSMALSEDFEKVKELRALEYAQKRQMDLQMQALEMKGFPKFDSSKGTLMKMANDPLGVVHFVPRVGGEQLPLARQGANNNPDNGKNGALARAMQEQQKQQSEFLAQQARPAAQQTNDKPPASSDFKFQDAFKPPTRAGIV